MAKPLAEHKGVVKSRKKRDEETGKSRWPFRKGGPNEDAAAEAGFDMEYVPGGSVRRITFEEQPEPEPEPEPAPRKWVPRHQMDVREIEAEVDRIGGPAAPAPAPAPRAPSKTTTRSRTSRRVYEEPRSFKGDVRTTTQSTRRTRSTSTSTSVSPAEVDRMLSERFSEPEYSRVRAPKQPDDADLDDSIGRRVREIRRTRTLTRQVGDAPPEVIESESTVEGWTPEMVDESEATETLHEKAAPATRTVTKKIRKITKRKAAKKEAVVQEPEAAATDAASETAAPAPTPAKTTSKAASKPASKATSKPVAEADEKEYQPQCSGLTQAGVQCRNSARSGSKYCASHKGYRPPSASQLKQLDTQPRAKGAGDTTPEVKEAASKATSKGDADMQDQCAALTVAGVQCRNSSRTGSKYCTSHKGYRPKSAAALKALDTAPRHKGAEDTKPALRKAANKSKKDDSG